jgi:hypothetical protein
LVKSEWRSTVIFSISWRARTQVSSVDFYGSIERGGQRRQPCPLGGNRGRLGGRILCGLRPELLDLRFDGGQLRAQRLSGLGRVGQDALDVHAQPAQLLLELGQVLNGLLGGLDGGREPRNAIGNVGRQRHLRRRSFWGAGAAGCVGAGCGACAATGAIDTSATRSAARKQKSGPRKYRCFIR